MKKIIVLLILFATFGCKSKKNAIEAPKFVMVSLSDVNQNQKDKAYELGKRVLMTCNTSRFKPFTKDEATATVIKNTTTARLTKTCQKFRVKYGEFIDIALIEVIKDNTTNAFIYRYKANYQWKHTIKELRVTINQDNRVSAIQSKNWTNEFNAN